MEKCVETQGTVDMQTDGMQVWVCREVAQAVGSLGIRVSNQGLGTWERACSSGMSRRRRMEKRISSGICSISESRGMGSETAMFAELGV